MVASIGQCVTLVTYAQAYLNGEREELDWRNNPWFAFVEDYGFGVGDKGGQPLANDPNEWFRGLSEQGFSNTAFFVEPYVDGSDAYMLVGFAGGARWAPVTSHPAGHEIIWHESSEFEKRGDSGVWHHYRGGFSVQAGQDRIRATIPEASAQLDEALAAILEYQGEFRPSEEFFGRMFLLGRCVLRSAGLTTSNLPETGPMEHLPTIDEVQQRARCAFPSNADPDAVVLVAAVEASWALGGMGWWNDWTSPDDEVSRSYVKATGDYYRAMVTALAAACEPVT